MISFFLPLWPSGVGVDRFPRVGWSNELLRWRGSDVGGGWSRTLSSVKSGRSSSFVSRLRGGAGACTISTLEVGGSEVEWVEARVASFEVSFYLLALLLNGLSLFPHST